jgi:hypothetical protein
MNVCIDQRVQHLVPTCCVRLGYLQLCERFALASHCMAVAYMEVQ